MEKLPEFFRFVRKVQRSVAREMKDSETSKQKLSKNDYYYGLGLIIAHVFTLIVEKQELSSLSFITNISRQNSFSVSIDFLKVL